jgi:hypothetical protein
VTVPDFSDWPEAAVYRTRFSIDRQVWVDMLRVFPGLGSCARRQDELALWIKRRLAAGSVDGWTPGRVAAAGGRRMAGAGAAAGGEHQRDRADDVAAVG